MPVTSSQMIWLNSLAVNEKDSDLAKKKMKAGWDRINSKSYAYCLTRGLPISSLMSNQETRQKAKLAVTAKLFHSCQFIDAKKTIKNGYDFAMTVEMILTDYRSHTLEEVLKVLHDLALGRFGKFYERFQAAEIKEAFKQYESDQRTDNLVKVHRIKMHGPSGKPSEEPVLIDGLTPSQYWKKLQEAKKDHQFRTFMEKLDLKIDQSRKDKVTATAERIFEKWTNHERLSMDEQEFLKRHNITNDAESE
jgi:hypothetical protein